MKKSLFLLILFLFSSNANAHFENLSTTQECRDKTWNVLMVNDPIERLKWLRSLFNEVKTHNSLDCKVWFLKWRNDFKEWMNKQNKVEVKEEVDSWLTDEMKSFFNTTYFKEWDYEYNKNLVETMKSWNKDLKNNLYEKFWISEFKDKIEFSQNIWRNSESMNWRFIDNWDTIKDTLFWFEFDKEVQYGAVDLLKCKSWFEPLTDEKYKVFYRDYIEFWNWLKFMIKNVWFSQDYKDLIKELSSSTDQYKQWVTTSMIRAMEKYKYSDLIWIQHEEKDSTIYYNAFNHMNEWHMICVKK